MKRLDYIWLLITRMFWVMLLGGCVVGCVFLFAPKVEQYNELNRRLRDMQASNRELKAAVQRLELRQQRFSADPAFVERTARELGMAKSGEVIYKYFADETGP